MNRLTRALSCIVGVLPLLFPATGQGWTFSFGPGSNQGFQSPLGGWNFRP